MSHTHTLPPRFRTRRLVVHLVGCGGNGSQMLSGLARLNHALGKLGHAGLMVHAFDPETVSEANIGRQMFSRADVGVAKATVLVHRVNLFFGLEWQAHRRTYDSTVRGQPDIIIGCVDTAASRRAIHAGVKQHWDCYWLDLGNEERTGQVVLGRWVKTADAIRQAKLDGLSPTKDDGTTSRLPLVTELFPHLMDKRKVEPNTPSCSLAEALGKQDLFINQGVSTFALNLLWRLLREGTIAHHGYFVNMDQGRVVPMPIAPATWARLQKARPARSPMKTKTKKRGTRAAKR